MMYLRRNIWKILLIISLTVLVYKYYNVNRKGYIHGYEIAMDTVYCMTSSRATTHNLKTDSIKRQYQGLDTVVFDFRYKKDK